MRSLVLGLSLLVSLSLHAQQFREEAIKAHMGFLASDLLEGRGTGTRGHEVAAAYVAAQFEAYGLTPGANGSWLQPVPFQKTTATTAGTLTLTRAGSAPVTLPYGEGFLTSGDALHADRTVEGDVVFVGFGITAPGQKYDDYAGVDVRGKIVALFSGAPKTFPNAVRAHYSSSQVKVENAAARGALAVLTMSTPREAEKSPWARSMRQSRLGTMHWLRADGTPNAVVAGVSLTASLSQSSIRTLLGSHFDASVAGTEAGQPRAMPLGVRASLKVASTHERLSSPNVVALVRGSDPKLREQYLVYTAHLDHVGITEPVNGDSINNGAFDNASGIAVLLEIARAFAFGPQPRRSILFVATTAEEKGLRGADYFANNPPVPVDSLVANINVDQLFMRHRVRDVVTLGGETNELGDMALQVARSMKIAVTPDPFPDEVFFVRSDQYPFIRRGIPALYVDPGYTAIDPAVNVEKEMSEWMRTRYHSPSDDLTQKIEYSVGTMLAEFDYRVGMLAANREQPPQWKAGDFFGETFKRR